MNTAVTFPQVEGAVSRVQFRFAERDIRMYCFVMQFYAHSMQFLGGTMTEQQEDACSNLYCRLDAEHFQLLSGDPLGNHRAATVFLSMEDAGLIEDALRFNMRLYDQSEALFTDTLAHFQQETRLLLAVLAADEQQ